MTRNERSPRSRADVANRRPFITPRRLAALCATAAILMLAPTARAQTASENIAFFGTVGQGNAAITYTNPDNIQPVACVPTSGVNGMIFLQNYLSNAFNFNPFTSNQNNAANVNEMGMDMGTSFNSLTGSGGTSAAGWFGGLQTYLAANTSALGGVSYSVASASNTNITAALLANELMTNAAVEIGIQWGSYSGGVFTPSNGFHAMELTAIDMTAGRGTISFEDPWGPDPTDPTPSGAAGLIKATVTSLNTGGFLYLTYPSTLVDIADDLLDASTAFGGGGTGTPTARIVFQTAVNIRSVPEPSSLILIAEASAVGMGLTLTRVSRRRRMPPELAGS